MATNSIDKLYTEYIRPLPAEDRLRLLAIMAEDLAASASEPLPKRDIMELHGLGKELWNGVDAQDYVNELRQEWDRRP